MNEGTTGGPLVTGARLLVDQLRLHGVERIFCVPGESFMAVLDELYDTSDIKVVTCRHEGGAAMMAEAYGKLTGRPGIAFVTRGPGATNASAGIHVAHQDSTPMLLFIGQIERTVTERGAFQEINYRAMFSPLAKWATQIDDGRRTAEIVSRAFHLASSGRPGPVVVALPEDMLIERAAAVPARPYQRIQAGLTSEDCEAIGRAVRSADRPIVVVGGGGWSSQAAHDAMQFAERWDLPIIASFRCQDYVDNTHRSYVGNLGLGANPALLAAVREADLILAVGARLGEISSNGYSLLRIPCPEQDLIHMHPDPDEIGRVYQPTLGIIAGSESTFRHLAAAEPPRSCGTLTLIGPPRQLLSAPSKWEKSWATFGNACPPTPSSPMALVTLQFGPIGITDTVLTGACSHRSRARWDTEFQQPSQPKSNFRGALWWHLQAMGTS